MQAVDAAVLREFERQLLGPGMVEAIIEAALRKLPPAVDDVQRDRATATAALSRIEAEIANLTAAVAAGGELAALVTGIEDREQQRARLLHQLASAEHAERQTQASPPRLREQLEERFADWRGILHRQAPMARQIVKKLLAGPLKFTPKQDADGTSYYEFEGEGTLSKLLGNLVPIMVASPTGFEPVCGRHLRQVSGASAGSVGRRLLSVPLAVRSRKLGGARCRVAFGPRDPWRANNPWPCIRAYGRR
jgi:hypothetical protein